MSRPSSSSFPSTTKFKPGDRVEISSPNPDFRGSWYSGIVVSRKKPNPKHYVVQYDKLFEDEFERNPLRKTLDCRHLRPAPPFHKEKITFKLGDVVDAYRKDGWWEGSITAERPGGMFAVFFSSSKDLNVFGEKDLRLHVDWIDGKWKLPFEQRSTEETEIRPSKVRKREKSERVKLNNASGGSLEHSKNSDYPTRKDTPHVVKEMEFTQGMEVEVTSDEEGFRGTWYAAKVIEASGKDEYLVQYKTLMNDDETEFLREDIRTEYIRPCPPQVVIVDGFKLRDEVDAYYNEGWWVGMVVRILVDCKYLVYFKNTNEQFMFKEAYLRPHQDWSNGKWTVPSKV
ncbi:Protein AGENET DOMAIN (AGD)-CONTAINING P1 [Linum perenne]